MTTLPFPTARQQTPLRLATAGIGMIGVTFGMARYGYGLLLPDIRRDYGLSPAMLGLIGTGSYAGYLLATVLAGSFAARAGARATATGAGLLAAAGMLLAGLSRSPEVLAAGILVAGTSAGLAFAPFTDAAAAIAPAARGRVLSAINCGTGYGVALAAPVAILAGTTWRSAWLAFAVVALLATAHAARTLPGRVPAAAPAAYGWLGVVCRRSLPLLATGVLIGIGSSAYWTFAVARLVDAGALSADTSRSFLGAVGIAGVLATGTAELVRALGGRVAYALLAALEATGLALLAVAPSSAVAAFASALLFGAAYNAAVGVQALWSQQVFAARPSLGIAATMGSNGLGLLIGPVAAGAIAGAAGLGPVLLGGAVVVLIAGTIGPREALL
jgi:predicted MFS family arabinose efflux permease